MKLYIYQRINNDAVPNSKVEIVEKISANKFEVEQFVIDDLRANYQDYFDLIDTIDVAEWDLLEAIEFVYDVMGSSGGTARIRPIIWRYLCVDV